VTGTEKDDIHGFVHLLLKTSSVLTFQISVYGRYFIAGIAFALNK
jgi:hypothetical protein